MRPSKRRSGPLAAARAVGTGAPIASHSPGCVYVCACVRVCVCVRVCECVSVGRSVGWSVVLTACRCLQLTDVICGPQRRMDSCVAPLNYRLD